MKYDKKITLLLVSLFLLSQMVGLVFLAEDMQVVTTPEGNVPVHGETAIGPRPDVDVDSGESVLYILTGVFIGTVLLLLIIRFSKVNYWKILFFISVLTTITIAMGVFVSPVFAFFIGLFLAILKIFRSNVFVHNLTELLIYAGIAVLFVPLFNVFWAVILLLIISAYDAFAVWQSRHMIKMAKFQTGSRLFAGLMVSLERGKKSSMEKAVKNPPKKEAKNTQIRTTGEAILGGGDIAFPLIFSGVVMESFVVTMNKQMAFLKVLIIPIVLSAVLLMLLIKGKQGKFYPAMPFLTAGCLIGYGIALLI